MTMSTTTYHPTALAFLAALALGILGSWQASSACAQAPPGARDDAEAKHRAQEIQRLLEFVKNKSYYGLRDPQEKQAIETLRKYGEHAAPVLAALLAEGHKDRKKGWIEVYRPLYIMKGMGPAVKVALPDILRALNDEHSINLGLAAEVLEGIGPAAKEAVPALLGAWEKEKGYQGYPAKALARVLKKVDPKAAAEAGVP